MKCVFCTKFIMLYILKILAYAIVLGFCKSGHIYTMHNHYHIAGNFRGRKFSRLSLDDTFRKLNFGIYYTVIGFYTIEELIVEAVVKQQNLLSSKFSCYTVFIVLLNSVKHKHTSNESGSQD